MENHSEQTPKQLPQYKMLSRGKKTKGNTYKDRYVEHDCPECGHHRAYRDIMKTRVYYTCLKRNCRHKWAEMVSTLNHLKPSPPKTPPQEES